MIDLHAHILPGVDDGPATAEASVEHARAAVAAGTTRLATTSHVDRSFGLDPARFADWREALQAALAEDGVELELLQGGELALDRAFELSVEQLRLITLGGGSTILLEPPFSPAGTRLEDGVARLQRDGFDVLLAHPERSPDFQGRLEELVGLTERGVRLQLTASSLTGAFGDTARDLAHELLRRRAVDVVASDGHGATGRPPDVAAHLEAAGLPGDLREHLLRRGPQAVVDGTGLPEAPALPTR